jgi:hypothetical protein
MYTSGKNIVCILVEKIKNFIIIIFLQFLINGQDKIKVINPLNAELNPICHLLALLGGATIVVVSRLRVNTIQARTKPKT